MWVCARVCVRVFFFCPFTILIDVHKSLMPFPSFGTHVLVNASRITLNDRIIFGNNIYDFVYVFVLNISVEGSRVAADAFTIMSSHWMLFSSARPPKSKKTKKTKWFSFQRGAEIMAIMCAGLISGDRRTFDFVNECVATYVAVDWCYGAVTTISTQPRPTCLPFSRSRWVPGDRVCVE